MSKVNSCWYIVVTTFEAETVLVITERQTLRKDTRGIQLVSTDVECIGNRVCSHGNVYDIVQINGNNVLQTNSATLET